MDKGDKRLSDKGSEICKATGRFMDVRRWGERNGGMVGSMEGHQGRNERGGKDGN